MTEIQLAWLAGLLEGEGSFLAGPPSAPKQPRVTVQMTDEDVVRRVADLVGLKYVYCPGKHRRNEKWKPSYKLNIVGRTAVTLMHQLRPMMGERRQAQIDRALACYDPGFRLRNGFRKLTPDDVLDLRKAVEPYGGILPRGTVSRLSKEFNVSRSAVYKVLDGRSYAAT